MGQMIGPCNGKERHFQRKLRSAQVVTCLEDLVEAHESGRQSIGNIEVTHPITEACITVAESHRQGGRWIDLPMQNRDLYVFHV